MEPFSALLAICVRGIHQWRGDLMISLISAWINGWVNNGDLRRHPAHCDVTVMDDSVVVMTTLDFHCTMLQGEIIWQLSHLSWILGKYFSDMIITKNQNDRTWKNKVPWWRHQMETFSPLLALCAGNSPVTGEFPTQRPGTRIFDVFFDLCVDKRLNKQPWGWWFETPASSLWRHCDDSVEILKRY